MKSRQLTTKSLVFIASFFACFSFGAARATPNTWTTKTAPPFAGVTTDYGKALVYPGSGDFIYALAGGSTKEFWRYSISGDSWERKADTPATVNGKGQLVYPGSGNYIYALGSIGMNHLWRYNLTTQAWDTNTSVMAQGTHNSNAMVSTGDGDSIYVLPSGSFSVNQKAFFRYDISSDSWESKTDAPYQPSGFASLVYPGSGDYLFGYFSNFKFYRYSLTNNAWEGLPHSIVVLGNGSGLVYPGSGQLLFTFAGQPSATPSARFRSYNHLYQNWSDLADAPAAMDDGALVYPGSGDLLYGLVRSGGNNLFFAYEIDRIVPTAGSVVDVAVAVVDPTNLSASFDGFTDNMGIAAYSYSAWIRPSDHQVEFGGEISKSTDVNHISDYPYDTVTQDDIANGKTVYIYAQARDPSGNYSPVVASDGLKADNTAPVPGTVTDEGAFTFSTTTLSASWSGFSDPDSNIWGYSYSLGTSVGSTNVRDWTDAGTATSVTVTGLSLMPGVTYFFNVKAQNNAWSSSSHGLFSEEASSDGISLDDEIPTTPGNVADAGTQTTNGAELTATWTAATDQLSGVEKYEYSIGASAGDTSVRDWTSAGNTTSLTAAGLNLQEMTVSYVINVRTVDRAQNKSAAVSTDGIVFIDPVAPTAGTVSDDGLLSNSPSSLTASWTGFADNRFVAEYEYSIGASAGDVSVRGWTSAGNVTQFTATGLSLSSGVYFINVRAKDASGNTSPAASTDGITVDTTLPTPGTVTDAGESTKIKNQMSASWTGFADAHSGIVRYDYSIGASAGATDLKDWTSVLLETSVNATELTLRIGETYYVNVRAVDAAGNLSTVASSDGLLINTRGGDVDKDGDVDMDDVDLAHRMAVGQVTPSAFQVTIGDLQEPYDGKITIEDANLILRCANDHVLGNPQYPWCNAAVRGAAALGAQVNEGGAP